MQQCFVTVTDDDLPTITMKDENRGTAIVTPDRHKAYISPILPKNMHTPEAIAKPIRGAFSCSIHSRNTRSGCKCNNVCDAALMHR